MALQQMLLAARSLTQILSGLTAGEGKGQSTPGVSAVGQVVFRANGNIDYLGVNTNLSVPGSPQWAQQTGSGVGNGIWIRATISSGLEFEGLWKSGIWYELSADVQYARFDSGTGNSTTTYSIDFARDSAGINIISTTSGWKSSFMH